MAKPYPTFLEDAVLQTAELVIRFRRLEQRMRAFENRMAALATERGPSSPGWERRRPAGSGS